MVPKAFNFTSEGINEIIPISVKKTKHKPNQIKPCLNISEILCDPER